MTTWNYSIAWGKFQMALNCPQQLIYTIDKTPPSNIGPNYYRELGIMVQFIFEQYFNQMINLRKGGTDPDVFDRVIDKILSSQRYKDINLTFPYGKGETDFLNDVREQARIGFKTFSKMGLLERKLESEKKWNSQFRGFRIYLQMDFLDRHGNDYVSVYDGKGNQKMNADPRQLTYCALGLHASGMKIKNAGLIYWRHGEFVPVDCSPKALRRFIDNEFMEARGVLDQLKTGTDKLPTNPSATQCKYCNWRNICEDSYYKSTPVGDTSSGEVDFDARV